MDSEGTQRVWLDAGAGVQGETEGGMGRRIQGKESAGGEWGQKQRSEDHLSD